MVRKVKPYYFDAKETPEHFPTHRHEPAFWEQLGRTVATYGFLEDTLKRAIFQLSGTNAINDEPETALAEWQTLLEGMISKQLWNLGEIFISQLRKHPEYKLHDGELIKLKNDLMEANVFRNIICHGCWQLPNSESKSIPRFINRNLESYETPLNAEDLLKAQAHTREIIFAVINEITQMGYEFPGHSI